MKNRIFYAVYTVVIIIPLISLVIQYLGYCQLMSHINEKNYFMAILHLYMILCQCDEIL